MKAERLDARRHGFLFKKNPRFRTLAAREAQ
jgi:hypothetical protein